MRTAPQVARTWWDRTIATWFTDQDTYVLPDTVHTNLARQPQPHEPGTDNHARGILVHLTRDLHGTPIALYRQPLESRTGDTVGSVVTAIARDHDDQLITVVWRETTQPPRWRRTTTGQLTVNGIPALRTTRHRRPPASWLARIAWRTAD